MSEYWKSNAKKYCDYCKTWIADNKASIAIHESGKNHKEKVNEKLKEIKKRSDQKRVEDKKYNESMAAIEKAAMAAMDRDLDSNPCLRRQYGAIPKVETPAPTEKAKEEKPIKKSDKPKAVAKPSKINEPKTNKRKLDEPIQPESKIGDWKTVQVVKPVVETIKTFEKIDLQLPSTSKRSLTNKFELLSAEELQTELQRPNSEIKNEFIAPKETVVQVKKVVEKKWAPIGELKEEPVSEPTEIPAENPSVEIQPELIKQETREEEIPVVPTIPAIKSEPKLVEKIVTLGTSNKKQKTVAFKKRKNDPHLRERLNDD